MWKEGAGQLLFGMLILTCGAGMDYLLYFAPYYVSALFQLESYKLWDQPFKALLSLAPKLVLNSEELDKYNDILCWQFFQQPF